ncbi:MAG: LysR family transcriptional regulator [Burkholderiales bacterium]|jgi:LysR family carnitine catabolism transcriptional activator|nr:LysR family transcriptional regulator [Betaproteobacteria bacterium]NCW86383.1 LysR family transcriptional regulator [Oxalobacteraceae bacterium]NDG07564.1 LysR family transcriptional regulator [Oxalobacteraceae bacterium]
MPRRARLRARFEAPFSAKQLRAFCVLSETLSFTEAAHQLGITQPSLSALICQLERHAGHNLFIRDKHQVRLSLKGQYFQADAKRVLVQLNQTSALVKHLASPPGSDVLRIAAPPSLMTKALTPLFDTFRALEPQMLLSLFCLENEDAFDRLQRGEIDLAFVSGNHAPVGVALQPIAQDRFVCVLPRKHPLASREQIRWHELGHQRVMSCLPPRGLRSLLNQSFERYGLALFVNEDAQDELALLRLVELGLGVGLTSRFTKHLIDPEALAIRPLVDPVINFPLALALPSSAITAAASRIAELLQSDVRIDDT